MTHITVPSGFIGPLRPGTIRLPPPSETSIVKDPSTGRTWGSVGEYVRDPRKYGGGSGRSGRTLNEEIARRESIKRAAIKRQAEIEKKALIEKLRQQGIKRLAAERRAKEIRDRKIKRVQLTRKERLSLSAREQLRVAAIARGRGFSRTESQRFLKQRGGSISDLRSAMGKGFRIIRQDIRVTKVAPPPLKEFIERAITKIDPEKIKGSGKFTRAIDVGGGKMQDFVFTFRSGNVIKTTPLGVPVPQSKRFIEKRKVKPIVIPKKIRDLLISEKLSLTANIGGVSQRNESIIKDVKSGKITNRLINFADIISGGLITERRIDRDQVSLNNRIINFNKKFEGKELSESEFNKATAEENFIDSEQKNINKKRDRLATSKRDSLRDLVIKFDIQKTPRLTMAEQNRIDKERKENVKIQREIKKNQPSIKRLNKNNKKLKDKIKEINKKGKDKTFLDRLKIQSHNSFINKNNRIIASLEFKGPLVVDAPIIPIGMKRIPFGITKIRFIGIQEVGKFGKIKTDISFITDKGRAGFARGVTGTVSKDGKTATIIAGRSGKVKIKLPSATKKAVRLESFIGLENVNTKSKVLNQIIQLTKSGEITRTKAQRLRALAKSIFKKDIRKISISKLRKLQGTLQRSQKIKQIDLVKNISRLRRRGLITGKKAKQFRGILDIGDRLGLLRLKKLLEKLRMGKIPKPLLKVETITKEQFIKNIKSFRRTGDITRRLEKRLIKRVIRLSKKGVIPRTEFLKVTKRIKPPKPLKKIKVPERPFLNGRKIKPLDLTKNISRLRRRGLITKRKAKQLRKIVKTDKPMKLLDLRKNLKRLRKKGLIEKAARETAREPGFSKIISRLRQEALIAEKSNRPQKIRTNIRFLEQKGIGQLVSVKGKKFVKGKKLKKKINIDDFSSISAIFTKKDLNLIIGKTITKQGAKSEFIGIIKGTRKATDSSIGGLKQQQQFNEALNKIVSKAAVAATRAEKTKPITRLIKIATTSAIISGFPITITRKIVAPIIKAKLTKVQLTKVANVKQLTKTKGKIIQSLGSAQKDLNKLKSVQKLLTQQKAKQKVVQKNIQAQKQAQKLVNNLKLKQKLLTARISRITIGIPIRAIIRPFLIPKRKKKRKRKIIIKKVKAKSYDVFAKPVKGKKLIKINKVPLTKIKAQDLRNYIIDTSLSRTGKIKVRGKGIPRTPKIKVPKTYARRTTKKFRRFRRRKGKRISLPKGKVIERRGRLLDTRQERSKITLRKRIKQLVPKKGVVRRKVKQRVMRKVVKKNQQRKISPAMRRALLRRLVKARAEKSRLARLRGSQAAAQRTKLRRKISII